VEVVTPEDHMGDVIGDLNSRRGIVQEFTDKPGGMKVRGSSQSIWGGGAPKAGAAGGTGGMTPCWRAASLLSRP